jgi:hypothetical protein
MALYSEAAAWAADDSIGYGMAERNLPGYTDCSAMIRDILNGLYKYNLPSYFSTHTMRSLLMGTGDYTTIPWSRDAVADDDILLSEAESGGTGHTAAYGEGRIAEAWIDETGEGSGGAPGDQTGNEVRNVDYYSHPLTVSGRWTHILRRKNNGGNEKMTPQQAATLDKVGYATDYIVLPALTRIDRERAVSEAAHKEILASQKALANAIAALTAKVDKIVAAA